MGQQQLLLLVLGIVIVGIAVVAGIQAFSEGKNKAQQDAAISDAMRIISDSQAWKLKPKAFGGGAGSAAANFQGISWASIGIRDTTAAGWYKTINGCYDLAGSASKLTITIADTSCTTEKKIADVDVNGTGTNNITWKW